MTAKIHDTARIYEGRVITVTKEMVTLENGVSTDLDIIRHPGATAIIPFVRENTLLLLRQYRHAVRDHIWEIPAGTLDPEESPINCAKRELVEETGYSGSNWQSLGQIIPVPGYSDELIHVYLATDLAAAQQDLDSDEIIDVHEVKFDAAIEMIKSGEIRDSKTISGLFMARLRLENGELHA